MRSDIWKFSVILGQLLLGPPTFLLFLLPSITGQGRCGRLINCALASGKVCTPTPDTGGAQRWDRLTLARVFTSCQRSCLHTAMMSRHVVSRMQNADAVLLTQWCQTHYECHPHAHFTSLFRISSRLRYQCLQLTLPQGSSAVSRVVKCPHFTEP